MFGPFLVISLDYKFSHKDFFFILVAQLFENCLVLQIILLPAYVWFHWAGFMQIRSVQNQFLNSSSQPN